jgi:hypothetical protein
MAGRHITIPDCVKIRPASRKSQARQLPEGCAGRPNPTFKQGDVMKKLFAAVFAGLLALGSMSAMAADTKDTKKEDAKKVEKKTTEKKERKGGC